MPRLSTTGSCCTPSFTPLKLHLRALHFAAASFNSLHYILVLFSIGFVVANPLVVALKLYQNPLGTPPSSSVGSGAHQTSVDRAVAVTSADSLPPSIGIPASFPLPIVVLEASLLFLAVIVATP